MPLDNDDSPLRSRLTPELTGRLRKTAPAARPEPKHRFVEWTLFAVLALVAGVGALAIYTMYAPSYRRVPNAVAQGISADRVNILLIGVGGDQHPGGGRNLADAIIVASFRPSTHQVALLSVPRDLYTRVGRYGTHRINRAHAIGASTGYPGGGPALLMDTVSNVIGEPIHGFVRVDFEAFEKVIDALGGVDITVPHTFYDTLFHDRFVAGRQHMNGERALRYARYRYINGPEGDNFGREQRQQQLLAALQAKLAEMSAADVLTLMKATTTFSNATDTNLTKRQIVWFYRNFKDVRQSEIRHVSLRPYLEVFEVRQIGDAGEALRPRGASLAPIRSAAENMFGEAARPEAEPAPDDAAVADQSSARPFLLNRRES